MRAVVYRHFGPPTVLELVERDRPTPGPDEVLVRVRAAGLNPYDWHFMRGEPVAFRPMMGQGLRNPKRATILGSDMAGVVEAAGEAVTRLRPGDEVYGVVGQGGCAEYIAVPARRLTAKPARSSFEEAAAVPMAAVTALQALRDFGRLQQGQTVLVNGASGGVGTFAVQLAKVLGAASVTGVCSAGNVELVKSIGADAVVDYTTEDFARGGQRFDLLVDTVGNRSLRDCRRALKPKGTLVVVGGVGGRMLGPMARLLRARILSPFVSQNLAGMVAQARIEDLDYLRGLIEAGTVTPVIDRTYPLEEAAAAMGYLEGHHVRGKIVIAV